MSLDAQSAFWILSSLPKCKKVAVFSMLAAIEILQKAERWSVDCLSLFFSQQV
jgi:hypothetical protein